MLAANELAFLDKFDAERSVPKQLLDCIYVFEDLIATKRWRPKWKKYEELFDSIKDLKSPDEFVSDDNDPVAI